MQVYPLHVPRDHYRGRDPRRLRKKQQYNEDAARLEKFLNERIAADPAPVQQYLYGYIAVDVGMSLERVREILGRIEAGHNAIMVAKSEEAWRSWLAELRARSQGGSTSP